MAAKKQPHKKQPVPSVCEKKDCSHSGWLKKRESDESGRRLKAMPLVLVASCAVRSDARSPVRSVLLFLSGRRLKAGQSFRLLTDYSVKGACAGPRLFREGIRRVHKHVMHGHEGYHVRKYDHRLGSTVWFWVIWELSCLFSRFQSKNVPPTCPLSLDDSRRRVSLEEQTSIACPLTN